jgi:UDP-4-amino-4,6-dideoxy-N-acetyl-beta-L-altrosamine transaminase
MIPYGRQDINHKDIESVIEVLKSDFLTQGPVVPVFEKKVCDYTGSKFAIAMNSATSALHAACYALNVGPGDLVWTSPITFVASSNCALYCGANVDFVDIDEKTFNMCPQKLEEKLQKAKEMGKLPKVVIPVHLAGQSCDMESIFYLSRKFGFKIIEDASHAIGGTYKGTRIGSNQFSDVSIFSFHPVKIITTGEGGMALTNSPDLANKMDLFRSHGITRNSALMKNESHGPWYYEQLLLGYNYRMTELQGALGLSQMDRLDAFVSRRREIASRYDSSLKMLPLFTPEQSKESASSFHLYIIQLKTEELRKTHREIFEELRTNGVGVNLHYIPVYLQPYYANLGFNKGYCEKAERYYSRAISIPIFNGLTEQMISHVESCLRKTLTL